MLADREVDQVIIDSVTLVSRTVTFDNGERTILCFSKRCRQQIAWDGHFYVAAPDLSAATQNGVVQMMSTVALYGYLD